MNNQIKIFVQTFSLLMLFAGGFLCLSCEDEDSYAADLKREKKQIQSFLKTGVQAKDVDSGEYILNVPGPYKIISEEEFYANDSTTNVDENEFVLFAGSGIYMQIVRKGTGSKMKDGESTTVICRYKEFNIAADTIKSTNSILAYSAAPDVMTVSNMSGTFTAFFTSGIMRTLYGTSVPNGWLFPFNFIKVGRQTTENEEIALVRLIVPSTEGQSDAYTNVYPCFYEISYERGR